ncbi:MAG: alpha/beta hydrolase-fold protein [Mycobacteriaceae bacterium]
MRAKKMWAVVLALPLALGLTGPAAVGTATPVAAAPLQAAPVLSGVVVKSVFWITDRRVQLTVFSPAMGADQKVQILLARDWNKTPDAKFPYLYTLDGLRAQDDQSGWTINTNIVDFYADKNINVLLPIGGQSSFYSNWLQPNNGKNYQWETFLTKELPPILENDWRANGVNGIQGLSMGGTSAMFYAQRNPGMFKFVGSYSGVLQTTSLGMPQAIQIAMLDAGGYDSYSMWGAPSNPQWAAHDPYANAEKLKGLSIYISSGSGLAGQYDQPTGIPGVTTNYAGMALEILSRLTSQNFASKLVQLGISAQAVYRPSGTHSWPYWQFEMMQAWPQIANALNVAETPGCSIGGAIGEVHAVQSWLGGCLTSEYAVPGGFAQDFYLGRVFWSARTGAHSISGAIGGEYQYAGGPGGASSTWVGDSLGLPTTDELGTPDRVGRFNLFERGSIYWTPSTGAHGIHGEILKEWARQGYEGGPLGYPTRDEAKILAGAGAVQGFQIGAMYWSQATGAKAVQGRIMDKYAALGFETGFLGMPKTNEIVIRDNGRFTAFEHGNIYWNPATGAWSVPLGAIFDAWGSQGYENGRLGYPVSDQFPIAGGFRVNFQGGFIQVVNGKVTIS